MDSARLCRPRLQKPRGSWIGRAAQQLTDQVSVGVARRRMANGPRPQWTADLHGRKTRNDPPTKRNPHPVWDQYERSHAVQF